GAPPARAHCLRRRARRPGGVGDGRRRAVGRAGPVARRPGRAGVRRRRRGRRRHAGGGRRRGADPRPASFAAPGVSRRAVPGAHRDPRVPVAGRPAGRRLPVQVDGRARRGPRESRPVLRPLLHGAERPGPAGAAVRGGRDRPPARGVRRHRRHPRPHPSRRHRHPRRRGRARGRPPPPPPRPPPRRRPRHSIHRLAPEPVYLPVPPAARERAKPFIDGTLGRGAQALTAGALLALAQAQLLSAWLLAAIAVGLAGAWFVTAATVRSSYLALFRRTLSAGALDPGGPDDIDVTSAEVLVERMASRDPSQVIAAMQILARRGRDRLISALVLYHGDEAVLAEALAIFDQRGGWTGTRLAEPLLAHPADPVRIAAVEALGNHGRVDLLERLVDDPSPRVRGYVIAHLALRDERAELLDDPRVVAA